ncbi:hypothetical protein TNCV_170571 [Trichonephila clavipes]|nr:hypothetical protein TNCV_170571 [Trichonephila clavipes]
MSSVISFEIEDRVVNNTAGLEASSLSSRSITNLRHFVEEGAVTKYILRRCSYRCDAFVAALFCDITTEKIFCCCFKDVFRKANLSRLERYPQEKEPLKDLCLVVG